MKMITAIISLVLFSSVASADNEFALLAGLRSSSAETDLAGASITSKASYQFGALVNLDLYSRMALRTGLVIAGRQVTLGPTAQGKVDLDLLVEFLQDLFLLSIKVRMSAVLVQEHVPPKM